MSARELEQLLKEKQKEERQAYLQKKEQYETDRNLMVGRMVGDAKTLQAYMISVKKGFMEEIVAFKKIAEEYGGVRSNSKGGFSIRSADGTQRVAYKRNVTNDYDERAKQAEALIKDFLGDFVKKRDKKLYDLISSLIEKNKDGDYG